MKKMILIIGLLVPFVLSAQTKLTYKTSEVQDILDNSVKDSVGIFNVLRYGAKADGTDDAPEIQAACDSAYNAGGGIVFVPSGHYKTSTAIKVKDNVQLIGQGVSSWIENTNNTGFPDNCVIVTGNIGDITNNNGLYYETSYSVKTVLPGDTTIQFKTSGDASSFVVGDIVVLTSYEVSEAGLDEAQLPLYINLNIVQWKSGDKLKLMFPVKDSLSALVGDPKIRRVSGAVNGYDGSPLWMAKNAKISGLKLTNTYPYRSSYAVFANGINNKYEDIQTDSVSSPFGSNALAYSIVKDIRGTFNMAGSDFCDFQNDNLYENITLKRYSIYTNNPSGLIGFSVLRGSDCTIRNINIDLGGKATGGGIRFGGINRGVIENCRVSGADDFGIYAGWGNDVSVINNFIIGVNHSGISSWSRRSKIVGNTIQNVGLHAASASIELRNDGLLPRFEYVVRDNILGLYGSRTISDRIGSYPTFAVMSDTSGVFQNNIPDSQNIPIFPANGGQVTTIKKTIGWHGATGVDFLLPDSANTNVHNQDLGAIIPAGAKITAIEMICDEGVAASGTNVVYLGAKIVNGDGTIELIATSDLSLKAEWHSVGVSGIIDATKLFPVKMDWTTAAHVLIRFDNVADNWSQQTAGKWSIYITYIRYK